MEKELGKEKKKQAKPLNVQKSLLLKKTSLKNAGKKPKFGLFEVMPFTFYLSVGIFALFCQVIWWYIFSVPMPQYSKMVTVE